VDSGEILETALLPGDAVSVLPLGDGPWSAESLGLKWPLEPVRWERSVAAISNVASDGAFRIRASRGRFMVILERICPQQ
jgi:thiamine pyrophosphokinase